MHSATLPHLTWKISTTKQSRRLDWRLTVDCFIFSPIFFSRWLHPTGFTIERHLATNVCITFIIHQSLNDFIWRTASITTAQLILFCTLSEKIHKNKQIQYHGYGTRTAQQHVAKHAKQTSLHTEDERKHLIHN